MLGEAVRVDFLLDPEAGACHVDPAQFGSALLNLIVNARDALPAGGDLTVRSANLTLDARTAAGFPEAQPGAYVVIEVADTGCGMAPEVLARATEPFFTTKEPGKGTGLGLSQVYGFVRQSDGFLTIDSALGAGTIIRIHLPRVEAEAPRASSQSDTPGGSGKVLVVEDDPDVRELVIAQLQDLGYATLAAASGPEALDVLEAPGTHPIDLVLTDVVMPGGMSGVELVRAARARRPGLKAVLTSGYTAGSVTGAAGEAVDLPMLSKPYQQAELARVIRDVLSRG